MKSILRKVAFLISATLLFGACTTDAESGEDNGDGYTPPVMAEAVTNLALESKYESGGYMLPYINVAWDYENGTDNISEMEIYCVKVGDDTSSAAPIESYTSSISSIKSYTISSGITAGESYDVWILTKLTSDDAGTKSDVKRIAAIGVDYEPTPAEAATVTELSTTYEDSTSKIAVTWKYNEGVENITKLVLYYSTSNGTNGVVATTVTSDIENTTSFVIASGLTEDVLYYVWIETSNEVYTDGDTKSNILSMTAKGENTVVYDILYNSVDVVYEITSEKGLIAFKDLVNGTAANSAGASIGGSISFTSTAQTAIDAKLVEDITLTSDWTPIGSSTSQYSGTFDGNSKKITNLKITDATTAYQGLFAAISGATVKDLTISDPSISSSAAKVGAIAGKIESSSQVSNCTVSGGTISSSVSGTSASANNDIGGLIGWVAASTVSNCENVSTTVSASSAVSVGGVVGRSSGAAVVEYCDNSGSVTGNWIVGGVLGYNNSSPTLQYSNNTGNVTGKEHVGGVCGSNQGIMIGGTSISDRCKNTGNVVGETYVGGVLGNNVSGKTISYYYNAGGTVTGSSDYIGGAVGRNNGGTVSYCYSAVTPTNTGDGTNVGLVVGSGTTSNCTE